MIPSCLSIDLSADRRPLCEILNARSLIFVPHSAGAQMLDLAVWLLALIFAVYWILRAKRHRLPGHEDEGAFYGNLDTVGRRYLGRSFLAILIGVILPPLIRACNGS